MKEGEKILSDSNKEFYLAKVKKLSDLAPKDKLEELNQICKIIEEKKP